MAKAAERTVDLNIIQIAVAILGFGLVVWNLWYVRKGTAETGEDAGQTDVDPTATPADPQGDTTR